MKKYRYQLRYCGAPYGDGEYEVVASAYTESGLERLYKMMRSQTRLYGSNSYIVDLDAQPDPFNPLYRGKFPEANLNFS